MADKFLIDGGAPVEGTLTVGAAKNAVLPVMAASLMSSGRVVLRNCRPIGDVVNMAAILNGLGCKTRVSDFDIEIDPRGAANCEIPADMAGGLRSSVFMLGPILGRFGRARVAYPGGCDIGSRPVDLHLAGLRRLGARVSEEGGFIICEGRDLRGADIALDFPSVGATENLMMAAVFARGKTTLRNAAREPEIESLQDFINAAGGSVSGAGTSVVEITGVKALRGAEFTPVSDRIEAGTYILACAAAGGRLELENARLRHLSPLIAKLRGAGMSFGRRRGNPVAEARRPLRAVRMLETLPYPGFPTDLQAQFLALQTLSDGVCVLAENMFETRFKHVPELVKMGADITVRGRIALVRGARELHGAAVAARDLRGGAALVIAGLAARGRTTVENVAHIDRGYYRLEETLRGVGASIRRVTARSTAL